MLAPPIPENEADRLSALYTLHLLDTAPEERFNDVVEVAAAFFQVPIAFVSLVDRDRQWLKAKTGLMLCQTSREHSFCAHAILAEEALVIEDAKLDARFSDNPFVVGEPYLRFYAGIPLSASGQKVGTLCIADQQPHSFSLEDAKNLRRFARMVERELKASELLEDQAQLLKSQYSLLKAQRQLAEEHTAAAGYVRSLLPAPLQSPLQVDWEFLPSSELGGDCLGYHLTGPDHMALYLFDVCGHGVGAALLSVAILGVLRAGGLAGVDFNEPAQVLQGLNGAFPMERHENKFSTMWYGVYDLRKHVLTYAVAGHPAALLISAEGSVQELGVPNGPPVGSFPSFRYEQTAVAVERAATLLIFSDGLFELRRGLSRVVARDQATAALVNASLAQLTPGKMIEFVKSAIHGDFCDDVSLLKLTRG